MKEPKWVEEAKKKYKFDNTREIILQTDVSRGSDAIWELNQLVKNEFFKTDKYKVLLVGAGYHGRSGDIGTKILCSYEIFNLAAYFEHKGLDYEISVVDIDNNPLMDIISRQHIFVPHAFIKDRPDEYSPEMNWRKSAWKRYLALTNQPDTITHFEMNGLKTDPHESLDKLLTEGIHYAKIPSKFSQKIKSQDIVTINNDIAETEFDKKFDFIICSNILYMLPKEGQQLAIYNMANALTNPGAIYLWEPLKTSITQQKISPIMKEDNGWLTNKVMGQMGLISYDLFNFNLGSRMVMFSNSPL